MLDDGYEITPCCLTDFECVTLVEALSTRSSSRSRAGIRHLMADPAVAALARSDRLTGLAKRWLGGVAVPFRATLFEKSSRANWLIPWHQDTELPLKTKFDSAGWGGVV